MEAVRLMSRLFVNVLNGAAIVLLVAGGQLTAYGQGFVSDEVEAVGGNSLGLAGGGTAALNDQSAVRANPAMLASTDRYQVAGSYQWPSFGRSFYQLGVIDGSNKELSAGVLYTAYQDDFADPYKTGLTKSEKEEALYDSKTVRKISAAVASTFSNLAVGLSGTQVEGFVKEENGFEFSKKTSLTMGVGAAALLSKAFRIGASIENLNNKNVADIAPQIIRAGAALLLDGGRISIHGDYVDRQRVSTEFSDDLTATDVFGGQAEQDSIGSITNKDRERKGVISGTVSVQNMVRLSAGYAQEIGTGDRSQLAAGVAIVSQGYTLSYQAGSPYLKAGELNQAVSLSIDLKI
jgi:hypothetical protein